MKEIEHIKARIKTNKGKTICICQADNKRCDENCDVEIVYRDRFQGWQELFKRDKYGR